MRDIFKGVASGFIATTALSAAMDLKAQAGILPELNPIDDLLYLLDQATRQELPLSAGWIAHFVIGSVVWGGTYADVAKALPGSATTKGAIFGTCAWLAMMVVFMPLIGDGLFGLRLGMPVIFATLALHLLYGVVLGKSYARM